jgi:glycerol-3-phosphate dehydrogenase (NAD(P)+)
MAKEGRIAVIGAGAWGTALANLLAKKGSPVSLWVFEEEIVREIQDARTNRLYLPDIPLSDRIIPSSVPEEVSEGCRIFIMVTPSHVTRSVAGLFAPFVPDDGIVVGASKGIENHTLMTLSEILPELFSALPDGSFAYLSGPSFAREVAQELPTAVTAASRSRETATRIQSLFTTHYFRVYTTPDVIGVELGGAVKNVMAIAAGISDGLGFGSDARAALITRGLMEMSRLGAAMGASSMTFMGLAGMGDLVLTCTGDLSRNRTVGLKLGQGLSLEGILEKEKTVAEGVRTTQSVYDLSRKMNVEMPITHQVFRILYEGARPGDAVRELMDRDPRDELEAFNGGAAIDWSP